MKKSTRLVAALGLATALSGLVEATPPPAVAADSHQLIEGSGSSWATNALNVWIAGVTSNGLKVVFTSTGSAVGRKDFGNQTNDFAVSDIGYQGRDPQTNDVDQPCTLGSTSDCRAYASLPIVAGGTSFTYHIEKGGSLVRNLRLSGDSIAKIFTGKITNWNDPQIKSDNNGMVLPNLKITPVTHAEGSGSTAQFTTYLDTEYPAIWRGYTGKAGETEYYPTPKNGVQQTGSDGVMNYISSASANGSIGYDEYSYALAKNYPVVKLENKAHYFTLPTQFNVAVALQKAKINMDKSSKDYLLQQLTDVYRYTDKRTYPMSSYSYMIIPTASNDSRMSTAKRQTLADFIYYSICQGQAQIGPVGYSSLPINLVQASFDQTQLLKKADPKVNLEKRDVTTCNNPTFTPGNTKVNHLAAIAPQPAACDARGAGPCDPNAQGGTVTTTGGTSTGGASGSGGTTGSSGGSTGSASGGPGGTSGAATTGTVGTGTTGASTGGSVGSGSTGTAGQVADSVGTDLAGYRQRGSSAALGSLAGVLLVLALAGPPFLWFFVLGRRRVQP